MAAFSTSHATVVTSATLVTTWSRARNPFTVLVRNLHPTLEIYVGPTGSVTAGTGYYVGPNSELRIDVPAAEPGVAPAVEEIYAIAPSGLVPTVALIQPS